MNLPNYFLADLPREATLSSSLIFEACQTLKRNRAQYLASRSTESIVTFLAEIGQNWRNADYLFRRLALEKGPQETGFSAVTLANGLDAFFEQLTDENLNALLVQDLGHPQRLDALVSSEGERPSGRASMAVGPEFLVHIGSGNIPSSALMSLVLGLLIRSAQFLKCGSGSSFIPRLFAHSIYEADPKLASCLEIAEWPGGTVDLESVLFKAADCVTASGSDETLAEIRTRMPHYVRFAGYGHRVSFAYITREVLTGPVLKKLAQRAADDVVAWNQLGCLSPHVIYLEYGGDVAPEGFAELLAAELARREEHEPRGRITNEAAAAITARRGFYEVRAASNAHTRLWHSVNSTAWTVVFESDPIFQTSCLNRFVFVKAVSDVEELVRKADAVRTKVSTVGLAADSGRAEQIATRLAHWGVTRICRLGQMQRPPLAWRHDGRPSLGDLILWSDWEKG